MAEDSGKFGIEIGVDTSSAVKDLKALNKEAEKTSETLTKPKKVEVKTNEAVDNVKKVDDKIHTLEQSINSLDDKIGKVFSFSKLAGAVAGITAVVYAFKKMGDYIANAALETKQLSNSADSMFMKTNTLKAWETTFKTLGLDAKQADQTLSSLQDTLTAQRFNPDMGTNWAAQSLGISLTNKKGELKSSEQVMEELPNKLRQFSLPVAQYYAGKLGVSKDISTQMYKDPDKFVKTLHEQKNNKVITDPQVKTASDLVEKTALMSASMDKMRNEGIEPLQKVLSNDILPNLIKIADALSTIVGSTAGGAVQAIAHPVDMFEKLSNRKTLITGRKALYNEAMKQGYTQAEITSLQSIAQRESGLQNIKSKNSSAGGYLQYMPNTIKGYTGNSDAFNISNSVSAFAKERKEFKQKGYNPDDMEALWAYHHLGEGGFKKAMQLKKSNPRLSYGEIYNSIDKTGKIASINKGVIGKSFPNISQSYATQSSGVQNTSNIANSSNVSNSSTTHIGAVNVTANNPKEFSNSLQQQLGYLNNISNMTGQLL